MASASWMAGLLFRTTKSLICKPGASKEVGRILRSRGCQRAFLVTDPGVRRLGLLDGAVKSLEEEKVSLEIYDQVQADPPATVIKECAAAAKEYKADAVIGFGGGSSMDVAKLVACLADPENTQPLEEMYGVDMLKGRRSLPLMLAPTTAGTGSEVTMNAIVTAGEQIKMGVVSEQLLPDWALLDAELTLGLPPHITADTGVDAMVHAIEGYTTNGGKKNPISDCLAKEALQLLSRNIRKVVVEKPSDIEARQNMLLGSCVAGIAFNNAPVGAVHALAYPLGSHFHVTHGLGNSVMLPHVLEFNRQEPYAAGLYTELAPHISEKLEREGVGGDSSISAEVNEEASQLVVLEIQQLLRDLGMRTRLTELHTAPSKPHQIKPEDVPLLTTEAWKQQRLLPNNVRPVTEQDIHAIYTAAI